MPQYLRRHLYGSIRPRLSAVIAVDEGRRVPKNASEVSELKTFTE